MPENALGISGHVLLLNVEDTIAHTVVPRLDAMGADKSRITIIDEVELVDGSTRLPRLPDDLELIRTTIRSKGTKLLIIDPFAAFLSVKINSWSDQHVRTALAPLAKLAEEEHFAVLMVRHPTKNREASPLEAGAGSVAIIGAARAGFFMGRDPNDDSQVIIAPTKNNLVERVDSLAFRLVSAENGSPRVEWLGISQCDADALRPMLREQVSKLQEAEAVLRSILASGQKPQREVVEAARKQGVSLATIKRAKATIGVRVEKMGFAEHGAWLWSLPESETNQGHISNMSRLASEDVELLGGEKKN
jgi:hypothetical protein